MTDFEKIQQELLALGWECTQGKGDHFKFNKKGNRRPITVSKTISGRSYLNTLSNIRLQEPRFKLGKASKSKLRQQQDEQKEILDAFDFTEKNVAFQYDFVDEGTEVRYVSPENRDWSKLSEKDSVMNQPYTVVEINDRYGLGFISSMSDEVIIINADKTHEISVKPRDIESWELQLCQNCRRVLPISLFIDKDRRCTSDVCESCRAEAENVIESFKASKLGKKEKYEEILRKATELPKDIQEEIGKYGNVPMSQIPLPLQRRVVEAYKANMENIVASQTKKEIRMAASSVLTSISNATEGNINRKKMPPFTCWNNYIMSLKNNLADDSGGDFLDFGGKKHIQADLNKLSYSISRLAPDFTEVCVLVNNGDVLSLIMRHTLDIYKAFLPHFEDFDNFIVRFRCPSESFDQYMTYIRHNTKQIDKLKAVLDEEDLEEKGAIVLGLEMMPKFEDMTEAGRSVISELNKEGTLTNTDVLAVDLRCEYASARYDVDDDNALFLDRYLESDARIHLLVDTIQYGNEPLEHLRALGERINDSINEKLGFNVQVCIYEFGIPEVEPDDYAVRPRRILERRTDREVKVTLSYDAYRFLRDMSDGQEFGPSIEQLIAGAGDSNDTNKNVESVVNDDKKNMNNVLDNKNPNAEMECLRDLTTRELLKEIKARGVEFGNVTIVVRETVNIDEI